MLPPELRDKVYRPGEGESYNIDLDIKGGKGTINGTAVVNVDDEETEIIEP